MQRETQTVILSHRRRIPSFVSRTGSFTSLRLFRITCLLFCIFTFSFLIFPPAHAQTDPLPPLNQFCFQQQECENPNGLYKGKAHEATECDQQNKVWTQAGYLYNCYAQQRSPIPLQVSLLGKEVGNLGEYIGKLFTYLIGISSLAAGLMIVWAGVSWLTSAGNPEKISEAKHKISNALIGLVLILGSYLILQTINPALISLKLPPIRIARQALADAGNCVNHSFYPCGSFPLENPLRQTNPTGLYATGNQDPIAYNGKYTCDDPGNAHLFENPPCKEINSGTCTPQFCPFDGCYTLLKNRVRDDAMNTLANNLENSTHEFAPLFMQYLEQGQRVCVQKSQCGGCADDVPWAVCVSSACSCTLGIRETGPHAGDVVCMPGQSEGISCTTHDQCTSHRCNFGRGVSPGTGECTVPGGDPPETSCDQDADCASNLCDKEYARDQCSPVGGELAGGACSSGRDCSSGLVCHDCAAPENNKCGSLGDYTTCNFYTLPTSNNCTLLGASDDSACYIP